MIVAILQARMSSTRLPGKVLKPILGKAMIERQIERLRMSQKIEQLIVATSNQPSDDEIQRQCELINVECFRGDLDDVLSRFYHASIKFNASIVVRLTADCPLTDVKIIDEVIDQHLTQDNDFSSNTRPSTFPDGLDVEVMNQSVLEQAFLHAKSQFEREHVTSFIHNHPESFKIGCHKHHPDLSYHRWTVDNPEDFELVQFIYEKLYPHNAQFDSNDIYQLLAQYPEAYNLNRHLVL